MSESQSYEEKKAFFDRVLTVYGRNAVLEVLQDDSLSCYCIHLAENNREAGVIATIRGIAENRDIPVKHHTRQALARISKNGKQDQGVAADIICPAFATIESFLDGLAPETPIRLLALDGITNPQNLGMIIRSAAAGEIDGILWSRRGNAALGPLVIKASAGTLYKAPLLICQNLLDALKLCRAAGLDICTLEAGAGQSLFDRSHTRKNVYVLGNESEGVSQAVRDIANTAVSIPMNNGVESLNVAVTASLIAYARGIS